MHFTSTVVEVNTVSSFTFVVPIDVYTLISMSMVVPNTCFSDFEKQPKTTSILHYIDLLIAEVIQPSAVEAEPDIRQRMLNEAQRRLQQLRHSLRQLQCDREQFRADMREALGLPAAQVSQMMVYLYMRYTSMRGRHVAASIQNRVSWRCRHTCRA